MTATPMHDFVGLSALLTGIAADKLAPPLDPQDIKQVYFDWFQSRAGQDFDRLLALYAANAGQPDETVATLILDGSGDAMRYLARSLILAWYLGSWYDPADLKRAASTPPPRTGTPPPPNVVISAAAYTQGWAWRVAQAHPMGYSTFSFGYWSSLPPSLDAIVGGASS